MTAGALGASTQPWFLRPTPNPSATLRLFCLPHAGADTWVFQEWQRGLPAYVEVCPIRLPGRGSRMADPPIADFDTLVMAIAAGLDDALDLPFAVYGHSMGALIAFELTRHLHQRSGLRAKMLCVGSCLAPQFVNFRPIISDMAPTEMLQMLERRYGTRMDELSGNEELMRLVLPTMRSDFALVENYRFQHGPPLDCPITAYSGSKDPTQNMGAIRGWRDVTTGEFVRHEIIGDHFFSIGSKTALLRQLSKDLDWSVSNQA